MHPDIAERLEALRQDFAAVAGRPFNYFFCPILFVDEQVELCRAHIVNHAFAASSRRWTVQRKDVDNFFGTAFESAFVVLQSNEPGIAMKAFVDPQLYRSLRPQVTLDGIPVEHFVAKDPVPTQWPVLEFRHDHGEVKLGLKMAPDRLASITQEADWQVEVCRDLRVQAVVSVLKAAHLTMFELLGYSYVLQPTGQWLGQILDKFYLENVGGSTQEILRGATRYFAPLTAMVRPVEAAPLAVTGTIDDGFFHSCWSDAADPAPWGILTYIRTGENRRAVLLPTLADEASVERFKTFLKRQGDAFEISDARLEGTGWVFNKSRRQSVEWPSASMSD
jgi:hypothetical protein